jgi:hypothetical protein
MILADDRIREFLGEPLETHGVEAATRRRRYELYAHQDYVDSNGQNMRQVSYAVQGANGGGIVFCEMNKGERELKYVLVDAKTKTERKRFVVLRPEKEETENNSPR